MSFRRKFCKRACFSKLGNLTVLNIQFRLRFSELLFDNSKLLAHEIEVPFHRSNLALRRSNLALRRVNLALPNVSA